MKSKSIIIESSNGIKLNPVTNVDNILGLAPIIKELNKTIANLNTKLKNIENIVNNTEKYLYSVNTKADMLKLDAKKGDLCFRSDLGKLYYLNSNDPSLFSSWKSIETKITKDDLGLSKARNIHISKSEPSNSENGDIWIKTK